MNWFKNWFVKLTFYIRWSSPRLLVKVHFYIWVESKQNLFDFCTFLYLTFLQMIPALDFCKAWKRDAHCWNENFAKYLGNIVQYERICYLQIYLYSILCSKEYALNLSDQPNDSLKWGYWGGNGLMYFITQLSHNFNTTLTQLSNSCLHCYDNLTLSNVL